MIETEFLIIVFLQPVFSSLKEFLKNQFKSKSKKLLLITFFQKFFRKPHRDLEQCLIYNFLANIAQF